MVAGWWSHSNHNAAQPSWGLAIVRILVAPLVLVLVGRPVALLYNRTQGWPYYCILLAWSPLQPFVRLQIVLGVEHGG